MSLIRPRVGQHGIDGFAHERANLVLPRRGHLSQRHCVGQLQQLDPETPSIFVGIIRHCADDLDDRFQHQLRGYIGGDVPRRCRFFVLCPPDFPCVIRFARADYTARKEN